MNLQTKSNGSKSSAPASNVISISDAHKISYGSSKQALATYICNEDRKGRRTCEYTVYTPCVAKETRQRNFIGLMQNSIATAIRSLPVVLVQFLATFVLCMSRNYLWPKDLLSKSYDTVATGRARASDSNPVTTILESFKCCCNTGITKSKNYAHPMFFLQPSNLKVVVFLYLLNRKDTAVSDAEKKPAHAGISWEFPYRNILSQNL